MQRTQWTLALFVIPFVVVSVRAEPPDRAGVEFFEKQVRPLLVENCYECHSDAKKKPTANFDYAGPLTEAVLLGCLASIFPNQTLEWNAEKMVFTNSEAATKFVKRSYRPGWEIAGL